MDRIHKFLLSVGIPANVKGFDYLHDAIEKGLKDKSYVNYATKIYADIAEGFDSKPFRVERCMRHAIGCAFNEENTDKIYDAFISINSNKRKLTNKDFITRSVLYLSDGD